MTAYETIIEKNGAKLAYDSDMGEFVMLTESERVPLGDDKEVAYANFEDYTTNFDENSDF